MVETFIALERLSSIFKVKTKTFIALDGPVEAGEGITVLTEDLTFADVVPGLSCLVGVPPEPLDAIATSKALAHDDSR